MSHAVELLQVERSAARIAGCTNFGDEALWRPALLALLDAIRSDAAITPARWYRSALEFAELLAVRGRVASLLAAHPEIVELPLPGPLFVVGLPRTGTTLLHNVLASHSRLWAPPLWQLRAPVCPAGHRELWEQSARADTERMLELMYEGVPEFRSIHPMRATGPDECSWLFRPSFATVVNAFAYRIPRYVDWLTSADMTPYYLYYRVLLQVLQWQRGAGQRLVLKDPCHLWHLHSLLEVFPDAQIVFMHRSVEQALPSLASLCFALQRVESAHRNPATMAAYCTDLVERGLFPALSLRRRLPASRMLDVRYEALIREFPALLTTVCEFAGLPAQDAELQNMLRWRDENGQHKCGRHEYSPEKFGFRREALRARFALYHDECVLADVDPRISAEVARL